MGLWRLDAIFRQEICLTAEVGLKALLLLVLIELTEEHCVERGTPFLLFREVFEEKLLLLLHATLVGGIVNHLLLRQLVLGRDRLAELRH